LLRDDKTYPYIYIDTNLEFPRLEITRKIIKTKGIKYFGPFSVGAKDMLDSIYEILPLVQKKGCLKTKKACLFYQINRCLAPCEEKITKDEYKKFIFLALDYIHNKSKLIEDIKKKMAIYSDSCRFEDALKLRDRIKTIEKSQIKSTLDFANDENIDIFNVQFSQTNDKAVVIKMFIRDGKLISSTHNFINITDITSYEELYKTSIINYYSTNLPFVPKEILIGFNINNIFELENFISSKFNQTININIPKIGKKKKLLEVSSQNCIELLRLNNNSYKTIYKSIQELFKFENIAYRYEIFDNSHIMGQASVGAMVVWDEDKFTKSDYRLYNLEATDEYAQMKEMLIRRVQNFKNNPPPDMWVLDGGKTLLNLAYDIAKSVGVFIDIVAIAKEKIDKKANRNKGVAKDILYTKDDIYHLEPTDKRIQFIQRLRDEAHRSAINFHKKQKRKEDKQISLLQIKGIGKAKVTKLLNYFGNFEQIKTASLDELQEVLNPKDAILLQNHFKIDWSKMQKTISTILSTQIGKIKTIKDDTLKAKQWQTGSFKNPVDIIDIKFSKIVGDEVADLIHHGGEHKVVFANSFENYSLWCDYLDKSNLPYGALAENLTMDTIKEQDVCIGDIHKINNTILEVSQPREPCWKISKKHKNKTFTKYIYDTGQTGWYYRVLQEGQIQKDDKVILIKRLENPINILQANDILKNPNKDIKLTKYLLNLKVLGEPFRKSLKKAIDE
jgi:excinuclease ABC subunit C